MRLITVLMVLLGLALAGCPKKTEEAKPAPAAEASEEKPAKKEAPAEEEAPGKSGEEHGQADEEHGQSEAAPE